MNKKYCNNNNNNNNNLCKTAAFYKLSKSPIIERFVESAKLVIGCFLYSSIRRLLSFEFTVTSPKYLFLLYYSILAQENLESYFIGVPHYHVSNTCILALTYSFSTVLLYLTRTGFSFLAVNVLALNCFLPI